MGLNSDIPGNGNSELSLIESSFF